MASPLRNIRLSQWTWLAPVIVLLGAFHFSPFRQALDRSFLDMSTRRPLRAPPLPTNSAIVLVDEATLHALSEEGVRWPFPRAVYARLIAGLRQSGAKEIVMDFTFFEESDSGQDVLLAGVIAATPNAIVGRTVSQTPIFWPTDYTSAHPQYFKRPRAGLVDLQTDSDGTVRHYTVPGSLAGIAFEPPSTTAGGLMRWHGGLEQLKARGVPVVSAKYFIDMGKLILPRIVAASPDLEPEQIAQGFAAEPPTSGPAAEAVRGKTVFVGANASGTFDLKSMPVGKFEPGVLIHWTAWTNVSAGGFISTPPRGTPLAVAVLVGLVLLLIAGRWPGLTAPTIATVVIIVLSMGAAYAALSAGWFFAPATPVVAAGLILLGIVAQNFWREQQRKREIQAMFGAYVDPAVVEKLLRDPTAIRLGGEKRLATVYFSDLAGFTDLSEKLPPALLMEIVNRYLQEMSECLLDHGAYIDKYIGDAVMAVFGAPLADDDHAATACEGALAAMRVLASINADLGPRLGYTLAMRIGINTGEMLVGNLGSDRKKNYTVLGDAVNLASRLEGANKEFGTYIMLGENTARAVAGRFALRPLSRLRVKGKLTAVEVFELVGKPDELTPMQRDFLSAYGAGYAHFAGRRFAEAAVDFGRALAVVPSDDLTQELLEQSHQLAANPPPPDWEPIITLKSK